MTIDDELILELIKPDLFGQVGKNALVIKIVGTRKIKYKLEEPTPQMAEEDIETVDDIEFADTHIITPDITVWIPHENMREVAIELENDVHWDFGDSLRQVKKYKDRFNDVRVIIPEEYERFAPLYKNEGFRVYLWKAKRKWQCLICGTVTNKEGLIQPRCKKCNKNTQHRLVGLKDANIKEYVLPKEIVKELAKFTGKSKE